MFEIPGQHNTAKVFTDYVESTAYSQILDLCNQRFTKDSKIAIMPDVHAGKGCTIGTTMTITDKVVPNLVGVDIGCGLTGTVVKVDPDTINFDQFHAAVEKYVPSGQQVRDKASTEAEKFFKVNKFTAPINVDRAAKSIGTLGGGNHFLEISKFGEDSILIVVHSGSRIVGQQVAKYHQNEAIDYHFNGKEEREQLINKMKAAGQHAHIAEALKEFEASKPKFSKELAYLEGEGFAKYMQDMQLAQIYASLNRIEMLRAVVDGMGWHLNVRQSIETVHNYIDMEHMILRKGAVSARYGEEILVPINMRDGTILATGKGNDSWNQSAPHGAGRVLSRSKAKQEVNLSDFEDTMKGVWTKSVNQSTLDESPMAYKDMEAILNHTEDTFMVNQIMKPLYNFKANN